MGPLQQNMPKSVNSFNNDGSDATDVVERNIDVSKYFNVFRNSRHH